MAGESPVLERIRAVAAHLDDEALAALANKGLVRRARKDISTSTPNLVGPHGVHVRFQVEDYTVDLAEAPTQSQCTCPATGICRHILSALLSLREMPAVLAFQDAARSFHRDEIVAVTDETLLQWAGKALLRKATQALANGLPVEFEESGSLMCRLPGWNIVCRWIPDGGLAGMICSCHTAGPCEHRVASVLAYQIAHGQRQIEAEAIVLEASAGAPRTRSEVLQSVGIVLSEMVSLGLARLSRSTEDRLRTLAVSAHGVDLPRLERVLRALADEVRLALARDAQAASANLLATAARIEALRCALARPTPDLVGVHRSRYDKVGDIELIGLGARQWRTRSGYTGLTVYFWDRSARQWATWTEARPLTGPAFDPASRYRQDGPWPGCPSPQMACRHVVRLMGAWRNRMGRLSGRPSTRSHVLDASDPRPLPAAIASWNALTDRAVRLFAGGMRERSEQDEIVLLQPTAWGPAQFDAVRQELVQPIMDAAGHPLMLVVPHTPQTENAIPILERHNPSGTWGLLGILRLGRETLAVEPIALYQENKIVNVTLDGVPIAAPTTVAAAEDESEEAELEETVVASSSALGHVMTRLTEQLESASEGGLRSARNIDTLRNLAGKVDAMGMTTCARPIVRLADQLDQLRKSVETDSAAAAGTLLRACYVVHFAAAQEIVATATAGLT